MTNAYIYKSVGTCACPVLKTSIILFFTVYEPANSLFFFFKQMLIIATALFTPASFSASVLPAAHGRLTRGDAAGPLTFRAHSWLYPSVPGSCRQVLSLIPTIPSPLAVVKGLCSGHLINWWCFTFYVKNHLLCMELLSLIKLNVRYVYLPSLCRNKWIHS